MTAERPQAEQEPEPKARYIVPINTLSSRSFELKRTISVLIEDYGDSVTARLPEFELYCDGIIDESSVSNEQTALEGLVEDIIDLHQDLQNTSDDELGPIPTKWKKGLSQLIKAVEVERREKEGRPYEAPKTPIVKLVEGLTLDVSRKKGETAVTPLLAEHFNRTVGSELADEVELESLIIPTVNTYLKHLPLGEREKVSALDPFIKGGYNGALTSLRRSGYCTVGDLRNLTPEKAYNVKDLGANAYSFLQEAFKPKPQTEL